ncbi:MAG: hypothetical protein ACLSVD_13260 [Eggerthellaceae bacterium]
MHLTRTCKIAYAVLAAIVALGLGAYVYQLVGGFRCHRHVERHVVGPLHRLLMF